MAYKVIQAFTDLKDGDKVYRVGDIYEGEDPKRIKDLLANDNEGRHTSLKDRPLIALDDEQTEVEPPEEVEAPKKGKK